MRKRGAVTLLAVLVSLLLGAISPVAAGGPTRFGAKLTPQDAGDNDSVECDENPGGACTWIMVDAYHRPNGTKAPRNGTIRKLRVTPGQDGGSFRLVFARIKPNVGETGQAKVVRKGPRFTYAAQPDQDEPYVVKIYNVNIHVNKGDVLGIQATATSLLRCSGDKLMQFQPPLPTGGPYRNADDDPGCMLMIEAQYG